RGFNRARVGVPERADSWVWQNADGSIFDLSVLLPDERRYKVSCSLAVATSSQHGSDFDRLVVTLPTVSAEGAYQMLSQYGVDWGFPLEEVDHWRAHSALQSRREGDYKNRVYSAYVFNAAAVGYVRLQFQATHYIEEGCFTVIALFGWSRAV